MRVLLLTLLAVLGMAVSPALAQEPPAAPVAGSAAITPTSYDEFVDQVQYAEPCCENVGDCCAPSGCYNECNSCNACSPCNSCCGRTYFMYENVFVAPYLSNSRALFAQPDPNDNSLLSIQFDYDLEYSPRFEVGYLAPSSCLGWRARYWHFESDSSLSIAADTAPLDDDEGIAMWSQDPDIGVDDIDNGIFTSSIELDVFDVEAQKLVNANVIASAGLR